MKRLSRREFFRTTGIVALGAFAAACAKKVKGTGTGGTTLARITSGHQQTLQMNDGGLEILSGKPDRLVFNLIDPANGAAVTVPNASVWIARDQNSPAIGPLAATYHDEGLPPAKGYYEAPLMVPSDGTWLAVTEAQRPGRSAPDFGATQFQVGAQTAQPKAGDHAISIPSPTFSNHRGVNPICTAKPQCSMHTISLDAALKNGKPTVLIIATPKFCMSALCGPETQLVAAASKEFGAKLNFIHVEVYRDGKAETVQRRILSPAAAAWRLDQEPAIYYIDPTGLIKSRTIWPADRAEVRADATALLG